MQKRKLAKLSELNIQYEYIKYLQELSITMGVEDIIYQDELILSYQNFKELYIDTLFGKDTFFEKMAAKLQREHAESAIS